MSSVALFMFVQRRKAGSKKKKDLDVIGNCETFFHVDDVRSALQNLLKHKHASLD